MYPYMICVANSARHGMESMAMSPASNDARRISIALVPLVALSHHPVCSELPESPSQRHMSLKMPQDSTPNTDASDGAAAAAVIGIRRLNLIMIVVIILFYTHFFSSFVRIFPEDIEHFALFTVMMEIHLLIGT